MIASAPSWMSPAEPPSFGASNQVLIRGSRVRQYDRVNYNGSVVRSKAGLRNRPSTNLTVSKARTDLGSPVPFYPNFPNKAFIAATGQGPLWGLRSFQFRGATCSSISESSTSSQANGPSRPQHGQASRLRSLSCTTGLNAGSSLPSQSACVFEEAWALYLSIFDFACVCIRTSRTLSSNMAELTASQMAKKRWGRTTKAERIAHSKKMHAAKKAKGRTGGRSKGERG